MHLLLPPALRKHLGPKTNSVAQRNSAQQMLAQGTAGGMHELFAPMETTRCQAKIRIYVEDWCTWIPLYVTVSGDEKWPFYPYISTIRKTIFYERTIFQDKLDDPSCLLLRKAEKRGEKTTRI